MLRGLTLMMVLAAAIPSVARAQVEALTGPWQQISSNAGNCPSCRITIDGIGALRVTASNGWTATIVEHERNGMATAGGGGQWRAPNNPLDGKTFIVEFELRGDRLHMSMALDGGGGRLRFIEAVFGRPGAGS
ncbi:hypothetical protein HNR60_001802 [Rhodopseudomonas rhenobacensis]|uniref:Uncharacterized protein n=1 Tax=Rhodopseudomonas rhenobacensis TaxID=87461 RepID=A0A7W7Z2X7_9BRAD|nr:hypothetical protein [Rhodopseudomonas rhenobacensis]MBB5047050.1 hypothetical protein [Rhodopseudomonas rhenobacensis]